MRSPEEFAQRHLHDAINTPLDQLRAALPQLARARPIVTVCGEGGGRSHRAALLLRRAGVAEVSWLCGGMLGATQENQDAR